MKEHHHYTVQLVGNTSSIKRMVASLYLVNSKKQRQTLKVCICDDLPHIINAIESKQRASFDHDLLQSGIILQVSHGHSLRIKIGVNDHELCTVTPHEEIHIPSEIVWESNTAFATDFQLVLNRSVDVASLQVSISSQDHLLNDVPLAIPHRVLASWHPGSNVAGVQRIRKAMEASTNTRQKRERIFQSLNFETLSKRHGSQFQRENNFQRSSLPKDRVGATASEFKSASPRPVYMGVPAPVQDKNWNVITSPTHSEAERRMSDEIPRWANKNSEYGEVVVV